MEKQVKVVVSKKEPQNKHVLWLEQDSLHEISPKLYNNGEWQNLKTTNVTEDISNKLSSIETDVKKLKEGITVKNAVTLNEDQTISGVKTFTSPININNHSTIETKINNGELKVTQHNSEKGFILRTIWDNEKDILPLELLSTNGRTDSYIYQFPEKDGIVAMEDDINSLEKKIEEEIKDKIDSEPIDSSIENTEVPQIHTLKKKGEPIYPITHVSAVIDDDGNNVKELISREIAEVVADAPENLNTLKEIADFITNDNNTSDILGELKNLKDKDTQLTNRINANAESIAKNAANVTSNTQAINLLAEAVANLKINEEKLIKIKYSELKSLKDNSQLVESSYYRITDYSTTTTQKGTQSAGHTFDVIVLALSNDSLSEDAKVILRDGDEYFANNDLSSWEVKYCLDNDTSRFAWADTSNGKGVIYYMKDNRGNECPYDFKNIKMLGSNGAYLYTFDYNDKDYSVIPNSNCSNNIIKPCYDGAQKLNFITISVSDAYDQCCYNTFGVNNSLIATKALDNSSFGDNIRGIDILAEYASYLNVASDNLGEDDDYSFEIDDRQYELYYVNIGMSVVNGRGSLELETSNTYTTIVERGNDGEINIYSDLYGFVEGLSNSLNTLSSDVEALKTDGVYIADNSNYNNHANLVGYFGNLYNYGVKGENIEIKTITAYARPGSVASTELYCKILIRVDGAWVKMFESKDPKSLQVSEGTPIEFEMERKGNIALTDKDIIAIVFHDSNAEDATSNFTPTGMKTISIAGALTAYSSGSLGLSPSIQTGWAPAFSFEYTLNREGSFTLHSNRDEDINSIKTFNKVINANQGVTIANKSTIAPNIDPGELKVLHKNSLKGFIVRTVHGDADILPLEILTTNGSSSYKYSFPNQDGKVILDSNVGSGIKVENGQIKADMAYINSNITGGGDGGGSGVSARVENGVLYL